ncbi:MAG: hypothetical protein RL260_427 [Pseudomonadota bacterium]|jgi:hypothetical protein
MTNEGDNITSMDGKHPRETLAANLNALINSDTLPGERRSVRAWSMRKGLDVKLIDRMTKGEHSVTIDKLQEVATALGVKAWQLLLDDFDPAHPAPTLITEQERVMLDRLKTMFSRAPE